MLRRGEIDEQAWARVDNDPEFRSLENLDFWREGNEVGPFEWDEIMLLLNEGVLDYEVEARIEGRPILSTLAEVIANSEEVVLIENENASVEWPESKPLELKPAFAGERKLHLAVAACALAVLACIIFWKQGPRKEVSAIGSSIAVVPEVIEKKEVAVPSPSVVEHDKNETAALQSRIEEPQSTSDVQESITQESNTKLNTAGQDTIPAPSAPLPAASVAAVAPPISQASSGTSLSSQPVPTAPLTPGVAGNALRKPQNSSPQVTSQSVAPSIQDFFHVDSVKFLKKEPKDGVGVWNIPPKNKKPVIPATFVPCLEASISAKENTRTEKLLAKAYFFDEKNKLIATVSPKESGKSTGLQHVMPILLHKGQPERVFFPVPVDIQEKPLKAVVVFGDKNEEKAACYPSNVNDFLLDYPEKKLVYDRTPKSVIRTAAIDPLVEYVVKTRNPKTPQITLFLRPPFGVSDGSEIKGVIALSLLAGSLDEIKRQLQKEEMDGDYTGLLGFANKHKLAVLAWGSTSSLWNRANYSDVGSEKAKEVDKSFEVVADAWERGVMELGEKYGIPTNDFLLWGQCGSAHWAHAICLHKPDHFLAIDLHIPGYFEKPTPEAAKVLWCITTGENYSAYQNSLRFVADCKKLGYPMVYKAIVGLGHAGHPDAAAMGFEFFEFALSMKDLRDQYDRKAKDSLTLGNSQNQKKPVPWPEIFQHPPFYGDMVNQVIYPADQVDMIPEGFRIPIPTKEIGAIWSRSGQLSTK